jgi:hypothetical protein
MNSSNHPDVTGFGLRQCLMSSLLLCISFLSVQAQTSVQRDQQALAVIAKTVVASGGTEALSTVQDFTATGTITYYWPDAITGTLRLEGRGLNQLKIGADLSTGKRTIVVNGTGGSLKEANGRTWPIPRQSAIDLGALPLPYLPLIAANQDTSIIVRYGGLVTHNGVAAYDIRIQKTYTEKQDSTQMRGVKEARDFYIDPNTFLITSVSDRVYLGGLRDAGVPQEITYSNYGLQGAIMVPLTIVQTIQGSTGFTMKLDTITFNSGLTDSDFAW